tara:strand:- start:161 stop:445 length:285 start_codon:yes stop_codon:yes gene_type:complete
MLAMLPVMFQSFDDRIGYPSFTAPAAARIPRQSGTTKETDSLTIGQVTSWWTSPTLSFPEATNAEVTWSDRLEQIFTFAPQNEDAYLGQRAVQP